MSIDTANLLQLERAELEARQRRLAAEADAERLIAEARARARALEAGVDRRIARAIAARRIIATRAAQTEVAAIQGELERLPPAMLVGPPSAAGGRQADADHVAFERAVELVVRAVLGEE